MPAKNAASVGIVSTDGRAAQAPASVTPGQGRRAPYALPLREVGWWTKAHREELSLVHGARKTAAIVRSDAAFDALHRTAPDPTLVAHELDTEPGDPRTLSVGLLAPGLAPGRAEPTAPPYDPAPTVTRRRTRWKPWRDRKGRARRSRETRKVEIEAHRAHASSGAWHGARAEGQKHRMAHVGACGVGVVSVSCQACGVVHDAPAWCAVVRLCPGCNKRRATRTQARFGKAIQVVLASAERAGTLNRYRKGGAIGQKHLVLTAPHVGAAEPPPVERGAWSWCALDRREREAAELVALMRRPVGGAWGWAAVEHRPAFLERDRLEREREIVRRRIRIMTGAAKSFTRELQAFLRRPWGKSGPKAEPTIGACWHRCFEWTPGEGDGLGHPHFHMWLLTPWVPVADEHDLEGIAPGGARRRTSPCAAPRRLKGTWGWAETMRRERCEMCVPGPTRAGGAWGWADAWKRDEHLDSYYRQARAPWRKIAAVRRRTGLRTWWAEALAKEGSPVDDRLLSLSLCEASVRPVVQVTEIHKPNGIVYRQERQSKLEILDASGRVQNYFEAWCIAFEDAPPHVLAAVYEGLEGKRLSQSSKVALRARDAKNLGFAPRDEDDDRTVVGLLGIADAMWDASCKDCLDVTCIAGAPPPPFAEKAVEVVTWKRVVAARIGPPLPPATAPPEYQADHQESYEALVKRLRTEERARDGTGLARMLEICDVIRAEGPSVLPAYRRTPSRPTSSRRRTVGERLRRAMKGASAGS